jgi:hypothetical protein
MAAITPVSRGTANYVDPNQQVISRGWVASAHQLLRVPRRTPGFVGFFTAIADADTFTLSNWRGPVPRCRVVPNTENTTVTAYPVLSGTTLTITMQTDAASSGWLDLDAGGAFAA